MVIRRVKPKKTYKVYCDCQDTRDCIGELVLEATNKEEVYEILTDRGWDLRYGTVCFVCKEDT